MKILINILGDYVDINKVVSDYNFSLLNEFIGDISEGLDLPNFRIRTRNDDKYKLVVLDPMEELLDIDDIKDSLNKEIDEVEFRNIFNILKEINGPRKKTATDMIGLYDRDTEILIELPVDKFILDLTEDDNEMTEMLVISNYIYKAQYIADSFDATVLVNNPHSNVSNNISHIQRIVNSIKNYLLIFTEDVDFLNKNLDFDSEEVEIEKLN